MDILLEPLVSDWLCTQLIGKKMFCLKFIYSEKATKFCEIFTLLLTKVHTVKSKLKISKNFVDFSEYMNFKLMNFDPRYAL